MHTARRPGDRRRDHRASLEADTEESTVTARAQKARGEGAVPSPTQREPPRLPHTACVAKAVASDAHSTATNASTPRCKHRQRFARSSCRAARSVATRRTSLSRLSPSESLGSDRGDAPACNFSSVLRRRWRRSTNTSDARRRSRAPARRRRRRVDGTRSPRAAFQAPPGSCCFDASSLPPARSFNPPTVL